MAAYSCLKLVCSLLVVSTTALQLNARLEEDGLQSPSENASEDVNRTAPEVADTWMSEADVKDKFGEELVRKMIDIGAIANRSTPSGTQYTTNWMSEQQALRRFGGRRSVMKLVREGKLQERQDPNAPASTQFFVNTTDAASMLSNRQGSIQKDKEPHAKASERHGKRNKTALAAKTMKSSKSSVASHKDPESHAKASERKEKKLIKKAERLHKKIEHGDQQQRNERKVHKRSEEGAKAHKSAARHRRGAKANDDQSQDADEEKINAFDRMKHAVRHVAAGVKDAASSVASKVGSMFKDKSQSPEQDEDKEDGGLKLFRHHSVKQVGKAAKAADPRHEDDSNASVHLPDVDVFMSKPSSVFQSLTARIDALKASLADQEAANYAAVKAQKAKYEANLSAIRANISWTHNRSHRLKKEVSSINRVNEGLRKKARILTEKAGRLRRELMDLQVNLTTAQEFIAVTLEEPEGSEKHTRVLRELEEEDGAHEQEIAHESALAEVGGTSLLQVAGESDIQDDVEDDVGSNTLHAETLSYVAELGTNFENLDAEQTSSELSLKQQFEEDYATETGRQQDALDAQAMLSFQKEAATELKSRLQAAVEHLERTVSELRESLDSLRAYARKMGRA